MSAGIGMRVRCAGSDVRILTAEPDVPKKKEGQRSDLCCVPGQASCSHMQVKVARESLTCLELDGGLGGGSPPP